MYTALYNSRDIRSVTEPSDRMVKGGSSRHYLNTLCHTIHFNTCMTNTSTSHQSCIARVIKGHAPLIHYHSITAIHKYTLECRLPLKSLSTCRVHTLKLSHRKYNCAQGHLTLKLSHGEVQWSGLCPWGCL